jgi:hypothetical protein
MTDYYSFTMIQILNWDNLSVTFIELKKYSAQNSANLEL